jgi:hypothetical protein
MFVGYLAALLKREAPAFPHLPSNSPRRRCSRLRPAVPAGRTLPHVFIYANPGPSNSDPLLQSMLSHFIFSFF